MLLLALPDVRDLVIVLWGAVSILLTLILLAVAGAILYFGRKGMTAAHGLLDKQAVEGLKRVQEMADKVRERTARLPGAPGAAAGPAELVAAVQELRDMDPPFRRKIKSWRPF